MSGKKKTKKRSRGLKKSQIVGLVQGVFTNNPKNTYNYKQISELLGLKKMVLKQTVVEVLYELLESGFLSEVSKGKFKLLSRGAFVVGRVDATSTGTAYIVPQDGIGDDVFVSQQNLRNALNGDLVKVHTFAKRRRKSLEGEVVEVLERKRNTFVGRVEISKSFAFLVTDKKVMFKDLFIPMAKLNGAENGQLAVGRITDWDDYTKNPFGEIVDVLGDAGENNAEIHAILAEFDLPYEYPEKVIEAAEKIGDKISEEEIKKRRDFRKVTTFTIDPKDAKDFDDALSIQKLDNGNWEVGVHIADVTHYVKPKTIIDKEGYERATSVYLVDRVVPMLPERLSNGVCSLRPHEEKLCFSVVFELDDNANLVDTWYGKTIIYSDRRFTYEEAQSIIETGSGDFKNEVLTLDRLAKELRKQRFAHGAISFERVEVKFDIDEKGHPVSVFFKESKDANKLIEEFMLLANKRVAEFIGKNEISSGRGTKAKTFVYRVHNNPDPDKFENFARFVRKFGYEAMPMGEERISSSINRLLKEVEGKKEQNIIETLAIRTMAKATYSTHNVGHYGLAFKHYSHFTSPIRRYPDMMVHRLLESYLEGGRSANIEKIEDQCKHCSKMEMTAAEAERASIKLKQVEFMKEHVGGEFTGVISGVTEWGFYVELDDNKCEGMVSIRNLGDDFYRFDEENYCIVGRRYKKKYQLGDPVTILVAKANLIKKQLDFELVSD
ncbi:ribonuclease R [Saccharicrinis fermentans]|uniref:Ribonuclease R n=1 Tax=Saccharicrinis fermentans DSM 9555 = JCM 21142 TaxID=869213 RepID=W7YNH4_9BACT|nr:ribonuclease R [Saccharicrinis fermentans]GAF03984.1 ribonuclease R [Saccharicrinis fermentans DSM 9555 = JCM 21142]